MKVDPSGQPPQLTAGAKVATSSEPLTIEAEVGRGAAGIVYRARRGDVVVALKVERQGTVGSASEAALLARVDRRWGPTLIDRGVLGTAERWLALTWTEGEPLDPRGLERRAFPERQRLAAVVAHGVGRGLDELHRLGVAHGDVKPANVVLGREGTVDRPSDRGATLIDLGLANDLGAPILGGTPRYAAPELRGIVSDSSSAADLYSLGLVLAEILVPELAHAREIAPKDAERAVGLLPAVEERAWTLALLARTPGARPSAAWLADRAARRLELTHDEHDAILDRQARVRRAYIAARAAEPTTELEVGDDASTSLEEPIRSWLAEAAKRIGRVSPRSPGSLYVARWIVSLVGAVAASWPLTELEASSELHRDASLARHMLSLAETTPPEAWTFDELRDVTRGRRPSRWHTLPSSLHDTSGWISVVQILNKPRPDPNLILQLEEAVIRGAAPAGVAAELATLLVRHGEVGRAYAVLEATPSKDTAIDLVRADVLRRRGELDAAVVAAKRALDDHEGRPLDHDSPDQARALLARIAWDRGDLSAAEAQLGDSSGAGASEVRALVAYSNGDYERGLGALASASPETDLGRARIYGMRGMLEHARGRPRESLASFRSAVDLATMLSAVVEEATYLTGLAAAAVDAGDVTTALSAATRGALMWERLGRAPMAARAHLSRAAAFALVGASHEADFAASEAQRRARACGDARASSFARWAIVETRSPGDLRARDEAVAALRELEEGSEEDQLRALARALIWAPEELGKHELLLLTKADDRARRASPVVRWEWWGARAHEIVSKQAGQGARESVLSELIALLDVAAPAASRGPALHAAAKLARLLSDGDVARKVESRRRALAHEVVHGAPASLRYGLASIGWLTDIEPDVDVGTGRALGSEQVGELEAIVRALSSRDRLSPLLTQVLDTMVLWTGVERGLLLLRAPGSEDQEALVPRAARNLAKQDLNKEQLTLSKSLARRAMSERRAIVATDAFVEGGDLHASVHALGLRSVLAVPLIARGDVLGVVYLDDRVRRGAFGPAELQWVRLVASQAALAIADARDQVLLRRAVRRAERANARLSRELGAREAELANARAELASASSGAETRFPYDEIIGRSEPMRAMLKLVDRVTMSDVPVLLIGESGTGKELVARAIHRNGPRSQRAFVSENCGSVPETLLESTLFGHVRGAFTGASSTRAGLFDVADGGTLFLDEIGEMPLTMQTKLLRVLQNGEVRPVGGEKSRLVNVRIVGATHRDLEAMVTSGSFREDLFYRLNVVSIRVPPLRERPEDIPLLVSRFVEKHAPTPNAPHPRKVRVTQAAMKQLVTFPWPGNVRQLENEIRRALVLADDRIDVAELSEEVARGGPSAARDAGLGLKARVDALEAQLVKDALQKTQNNQTRAAEVLGISRFGLQKMMRRLGIRLGN